MTKLRMKFRYCKEWREKYVTLESDFANRKETLRALSRFLLINIDEYDQISKAQTAFLKHLIQRTDVKECKLYSTTFEQQQRYAAFCATTNSLGLYLRRKGFEHGEGRKRRCYKIAANGK